METEGLPNGIEGKNRAPAEGESRGIIGGELREIPGRDQGKPEGELMQHTRNHDPGETE